MKCFLSLLALAAFAIAENAPYNNNYQKASYETYPDTNPYYNFNYNVNNADNYEQLNFQQTEDRSGQDTHGEYSVQLPDGRIQTVTYQVNGDSGFIADVKYEGEAKAYDYHAKPAYKTEPAYAPAPAYVPAPAYAPKPAYVAEAPKHEYGPVRFNPFG